MIRNERQYRITKSQLEEFEHTLKSLQKAPTQDIHPRLVQAQRDAIISQVEELQGELSAYDALQSGRAKVLELASLDELPEALIKARIAAGLTQRELAERLAMKEQQLQRYEATNYAGASLERIREVVSALGINVREDVFLPGFDITVNRLLYRAQSAGLSKDFITKRILSRSSQEKSDSTTETIALRAAALLNRIYGWAPAVLFGSVSLPTSNAGLVGARLKLPANASTRSTEAYAAYARYLAELVLRATPTLPSVPIPTGSKEVHAAILSIREDLSFASALDYAWSLGVAVLPLSDKGAFHGATWRISGRNIVVLKQGVRFEARWLHDLLHELRHAAEEPDSSELAFIDYETLARENGSVPAETTASVFAGDVILHGRAEELAQYCVKQASGKIERLKAVVPRVAERHGVPVDALANYMAYRLALQGASWWGAATNLQKTGVDPWEVARDRLLSHLNLSELDDTERTVLLRALERDAT
jgi:transcriptional regulator with XRE-family HTH domain